MTLADDSIQDQESRDALPFRSNNQNSGREAVPVTKADPEISGQTPRFVDTDLSLPRSNQTQDQKQQSGGDEAQNFSSSRSEHDFRVASSVPRPNQPVTTSEFPEEQNATMRPTANDTWSSSFYSSSESASNSSKASGLHEGLQSPVYTRSGFQGNYGYTFVPTISTSNTSMTLASVVNPGHGAASQYQSDRTNGNTQYTTTQNQETSGVFWDDRTRQYYRWYRDGSGAYKSERIIQESNE